MKAKDLERHCDGLILCPNHSDLSNESPSSSSSMRLLQRSNHWKPVLRHQDDSEELLLTTSATTSSTTTSSGDASSFSMMMVSDELEELDALVAQCREPLFSEAPSDLPCSSRSSVGRLVRCNGRVRKAPEKNRQPTHKKKPQSPPDKNASSKKAVRFAQDSAGKVLQDLHTYDAQLTLVESKEELWYSAREMQQLQRQMNLEVNCCRGYVRPVVTCIWDLAQHYPVPRVPQALEEESHNCLYNNGSRHLIQTKVLELLQENPTVQSMRGLERYFSYQPTTTTTSTRTATQVHQVLHTQAAMHGSPCHLQVKWRVLARTAHVASQPSVSVAHLLAYCDEVTRNLD